MEQIARGINLVNYVVFWLYYNFSLKTILYDYAKILVKIFKVSHNNPCQLYYSTYVCNTEMWPKKSVKYFE